MPPASDDDAKAPAKQLEGVSSMDMLRTVLRRHAVISTANLAVSTALYWRAAHAVKSPSFASFVLGWPASELAHVMLVAQLANLLTLHWLNPNLFRTSWLAQASLLVNAWSAGIFAKAVAAHLQARSEFAAPMLAQGKIDQMAGSSALLRAAAFIPLFSVVRRFKTVKRLNNVPYADLQVTDPTLHVRISNESRTMRMLNVAVLRGFQSMWNSLDVIAMPNLPPGSPVLMYVHGGGWFLGDKSFAGYAMLQRVAARGVVVVTINYRMAPEAPFPAQIIDAKRALLWVKRHCHEFNGDARKVFVSGESAGGHLTALMATTANLPMFQPPEEPQADTSIAGAIPLCGVFDFSDRNSHMLELYKRSSPLTSGKHGTFRPFIERVVLQTAFHINESAFDNASPTYHASLMAKSATTDPKLCPLMVVHGTLDALASLDDAKEFFKQVIAVRARWGTWAPGESDIFVEVGDGHHAFGYFPSPRAMTLADATVDFILHHSKRVSGGA